MVTSEHSLSERGKTWGIGWVKRKENIVRVRDVLELRSDVSRSEGINTRLENQAS